MGFFTDIFEKAKLLPALGSQLLRTAESKATAQKVATRLAEAQRPIQPTDGFFGDIFKMTGTIGMPTKEIPSISPAKTIKRQFEAERKLYPEKYTTPIRFPFTKAGEVVPFIKGEPLRVPKDDILNPILAGFATGLVESIPSVIKTIFQIPKVIKEGALPEATEETRVMSSWEMGKSIQDVLIQNKVKPETAAKIGLVAGGGIGIIDALFAGSIGKGIVRGVLKGTEKQVAKEVAWSKLGQPKTLQEAEINWRTIMHEVHPDKITGSELLAREANSAIETLRTQGLPSKITEITRRLLRTFEMTPKEFIEGGFGLARKEMVAPMGITGELPGYAELVPRGQAGFIGKRPMKRVGVPEVPKIIPKELQPLAQEVRKYKSAEEFVNSSDAVSYLSKTQVSGSKQLILDVKPEIVDKSMKNIPFSRERGDRYAIIIIREDASGRSVPQWFGFDTPEKAQKALSKYQGIFDSQKSQLTDFYNQAIKGVKEVKPVLPREEVPTEVPPIKPPIPPVPPQPEMPQFAGEPIGDPIVKLNELIKQAKPKRGILEAKYTEERARRIREVERVIDEVGGEKGYIMALGKLKGELVPPRVKAVFEPIKEKISKPELDALYNRAFKHPYLDEWEKISAANELTNLLSGELPTPKGLVLLEEIYGTDLIKSILAKRALGMKITDVLIDLANLPRAFMATADMSGFLRQGIVYVVSRPIIAIKAMGKTFQFAFSPKAFEQYFKDLPKDKLYPLMRKSGLAITDPSRALATGREEVFISRLAQQIPILGHIMRFAERSYVGFLNKLRIDVFKTQADEFLSKGFSPIKNRELFDATADVINTFTGRGSLGVLNRITPALNTLFFSPRLIAARFNALNPVWYAKMPKEIRMKAISDFGKFVAAGLTLLAIIKANDWADVEVDPRSSDFGKIRIGNTRWDIWGGFQQWVRVFSQVITGERKNTATGEIISLTKDEYPFTTRKEVVLRFIEGKLAPIPALVNELISGTKTFQGEDLTFETVIKEKFIPMYIQDMSDAYAEGGLGRVVGTGIPAFFGIGVQTWEAKGKGVGGLKFDFGEQKIQGVSPIKFNF